MRPSEIIALEWRDIDFNSNTISVTKRIRDGHTEMPKGYKTRIIDLLPQAKDALIAQKFNTGMKTNVFLTQYGKKFNTPDTLDATFKKVCAKAGVKIERFYNTKHTFTTMMLENGMNETWLTQQLGHEKIDVTRKHYIGKLKLDIEKINKIVV
jgi:integrase